MTGFVDLWVFLASTPLFGLTATLATYVLAVAFYERVGRAPWANPIFWSVLVLGAILVSTGTSYSEYFAGAQFVHVLLGPAVVALAWPLWLRRAEMRRRGVALLITALVAGVIGSGSAVALGWAFGLPTDVLLSLAPKSVTAPVAMGVAERIGGIPELAAVFAVATGMIGAMSATHLFNFMGIRDWPVRGFATGTAASGIGAARALQVHADAGAYAAIALGLQVILVALLMPLAVRWLG